MAKNLQENEAGVARLRGPSREAVEALSDLKNEPDWMRARRLEAWEAYENTELPKWTYTDSRTFMVDDLAPFTAPGDRNVAGAALPPDVQDIVKGERRAAGLLVQNDSVAVHQHMAEELSAQGVIMTDMDTAVQQHSELVQEHFMAGGMSFAEDRFVALQGALWSGGLFLYVPKNVEVKLPFYFYQALTRQDGMVHPYHLVILESGAVATLYEEYASPSDDQDAGAHPYSGANTLMHLKDGSHLRLIVVQRWGTNVTEVSKHQALVGRDARFSGTSALIGGGKVNTRVRAELRGQGAHSEMHTLVLAAGKQHIDVVNENRHHNANTHGDMIAKQVLRDTCRTAFQGLIYIDENSPQSTDYLTENALVLDRGARADAIPGLEILNDDVQASHGATVGQLDEEQIFYLMARGIPRGEAEMLIVNGFFAPLLQRVPEEDTRDRLARFIQAKIKRES